MSTKGVKIMDREFDEVVRLCRTCAKAKVISVTGDYICKKYGVVKHDHICRKYKLNEFLPRPAKARLIDTAKFDISDFQV